MLSVVASGVNGLESTDTLNDAHDTFIAWDDTFYVESVSIGYVCVFLSVSFYYLCLRC